MSRSVLTNLDLNKNEIQNAVLQPLATAPANPKQFQVYTNSQDRSFTSMMVRNGNRLAWSITRLVERAQ